MTAYDRVVDLLRGDGRKVSHPREGEARAKCPAHNGDSDNSLSVKRTSDRALLHCHGGCDKSEVLDALGLTLSDLYDNPRTEYHYTDPLGTVVRTVSRTYDSTGNKKNFRQAGDTKTNHLFRLPQVLDAVKAGQVIYLVEGEADVVALDTAGVVATTAPQGANNVHLADLTPLHGADVVAVVDKDAAGRKWAAKVRDALDGSAKSLTFVEARIGKDASDHIAAGLDLDDLVEVDEDDDTALLSLVRTGDWLDAQDFPPTQWAVPGLVPEGFGLFTGAPKIGKSWAALGLGLSVARGDKALGKVPTGPARPVLYLALEDGQRRLQWRSRRLLHGEPIPSTFHEVTELTPAQVIPLIRAWLRKYGAQRPLVMLDTLGKVMPPAIPGESAYNRDYRVGSQLKAVIDAHPGATLLVIHHVRKANGEDWMDSTSGTNGLNGAADFTLNLHRKRNDSHGIIRVTGRDVAENEYAVTTDEGAWTLDGDDLVEAAQHAEQARATQNLGDTATRVLEYVAAQPEPVTAKQVVDALDLPRARDYLARLVESGRLTKAGRGRYGVSVASAASVANEGSLDSHPLWQVSEDEPNATDATDATPTSWCACGQPVSEMRAAYGKADCLACEDRRREAS